jgi:hypothetical protein
MSVITVVEAVPSRIEGVVEYVAMRSPVSDAELRDAISPPALRQSDMIGQVVTACEDLQLLRRDGDEWSPGVTIESRDELRDYLENLLLGPQAEKAKQPNVGKAIAWFLTLDPADPPSIRENWAARINRDCPGSGAWDITDDARVGQLAYWVVYLGFGWRLSSTRGQMLEPDPTVAVGRHIRRIYKAGERTTLRSAITRLGEDCPVLDSGAIRTPIEANLPPDSGREPGTISRSTSVALSRLEQKGIIELSMVSDADTLTVSWPERRVVSHLTSKAGH